MGGKASIENEWIGLPLRKGQYVCWNPPTGTFALTSFFSQGDCFILVQPCDTPGSLGTIVTLTKQRVRLGIRVQMETHYCVNIIKLLCIVLP